MSFKTHFLPTHNSTPTFGVHARKTCSSSTGLLECSTQLAHSSHSLSASHRIYAAPCEDARQQISRSTRRPRHYNQPWTKNATAPMIPSTLNVQQADEHEAAVARQWGYERWCADVACGVTQYDIDGLMREGVASAAGDPPLHVHMPRQSFVPQC